MVTSSCSSQGLRCAPLPSEQPRRPEALQFSNNPNYSVRNTQPESFRPPSQYHQPSYQPQENTQAFYPPMGYPNFLSEEANYQNHGYPNPYRSDPVFFQQDPRHQTPQSNFYTSTPGHLGLSNSSNSAHVKAMPVPKYSGPAESKTPYDFLVELEKYQMISRTSEQTMLTEVAPMALEGQAFFWYRFESRNEPFADWNDFKQRFRLEFQALGYEDELRKELEVRTQGPTEPLTAYIRVILDYFERLGLFPSEEEVVKRIKRNMHPQYLQILQGRRIDSVKDLMDGAVEAQKIIKAYRAYKPPPSFGGLEPTLRWKDTFPPRPDNYSAAGVPRLHPHAVDPYEYFHSDNKKQVQFSEPIKVSKPVDNPRSYDQSRSVSPKPYSGERVFPSPNRPSTPIPEKRCYRCNSLDHLRPDCPLLANSPKASGNGQNPTTSPRR